MQNHILGCNVFNHLSTNQFCSYITYPTPKSNILFNEKYPNFENISTEN